MIKAKKNKKTWYMVLPAQTPERRRVSVQTSLVSG